VGKGSLASVHSMVGLVAGLSSIVGALYSAVQYLKPPAGDVVAVVREAKTHQPVRDATVEVLTAEDTVVTTLIPADDGRARQELKEGQYVVRVSAPSFEPQSRPIQVQGGATAQVHFLLAQRVAAVSRGRRSGPVDGAARAVNKSVNAVQRLFRGLGL